MTLFLLYQMINYVDAVFLSDGYWCFGELRTAEVLKSSILIVLQNRAGCVNQSENNMVIKVQFYFYNFYQ